MEKGGGKKSLTDERDQTGESTQYSGEGSRNMNEELSEIKPEFRPFWGEKRGGVRAFGEGGKWVPVSIVKKTSQRGGYPR